MTARPFVTWIDMESTCGCFRKNCKHRRQVAAENAERRLLRAQYEALSDDDVAWLRDRGWTA